MLQYKIVSEDDNKIVYRYYPECKEQYGEIYIDKNTKKYGILERNYDYSPISDWYVGHMYMKVRELIQNNSYEESGMIAWY